MVVGVASILWTLWNTRNGACFGNIFPVDAVSITSQISRYIHFLAGLHFAEDKASRQAEVRGQESISGGKWNLPSERRLGFWSKEAGEVRTIFFP
jgi:hypothetical protein